MEGPFFGGLQLSKPKLHQVWMSRGGIRRKLAQLQVGPSAVALLSRFVMFLSPEDKPYLQLSHGYHALVLWWIKVVATELNMQDPLVVLMAGDIPFFTAAITIHSAFDAFRLRSCQGSEELYAQAWEWAHGNTCETCGLLAAQNTAYLWFSTSRRAGLQTHEISQNQWCQCVSLPVQSRLWVCAVHSATSLNMWVRSSHVRPSSVRFGFQGGMRKAMPHLRPLNESYVTKARRCLEQLASRDRGRDWRKFNEWTSCPTGRPSTR